MGDFIHTPALPRRAALAGLLLGAGLVQLGRPAAANAQTTNTAADKAASGAARASGPIVQHGLGPRLTIHALDTYHGAPATGMKIDFSVLDGSDFALLKSFVVNSNGRADDPLLIDAGFRAGRYQLLLHADEYFAGKQAGLPAPPFLTKVPIRFQIVDTTERIHLPIQFGPWSYTYSRGS